MEPETESRRTITVSDEETQVDGEQAETKPNIPPPPKAPEATFTQSQVEAMIQDRLTKTKKRQEQTLKELKGDRTVEEVKQILEQYDAQIAEQQSTAERAIAEAEKLSAAAQQQLAEAAADKLMFTLGRALVAPATDEEGNPLPALDPEHFETVLDGAVRLAQQVDEDEEDPIAAAVAATRVKFAPMFTAGSEPPVNGSGKRPAPTPSRKIGEGSQNGTDRAQSAIEAFKKQMGRV